jgi:hypothetical protein
MDNIKNLQRNWLGAGLTLALIGATIAPASAQSVIIINGGHQPWPAAGGNIYHRPIRTQIHVNPVNKKGHWDNDYRYHRRNDYYHPRTTIYSYPTYPQTIINPVLTYPNVVNPIFHNSTIRNPVFDNNYRHRQYHQPYRGRSRGVLIYGR